MICCPGCDSPAYETPSGSYKCRLCYLTFPLSKARYRQAGAPRGPKAIKPRVEKYKGTPAGKIIYPGYVYGGTRLG
jgi:hypothetical protein